MRLLKYVVNVLIDHSHDGTNSQHVLQLHPTSNSIASRSVSDSIGWQVGSMGSPIA
jgi:hypothetical protein